MKTILCKNCKHWIHHGPGAEWGDCKRLMDYDTEPYLFDLDQHYCERETEVETHPDFGCILGEEK